MNRESLNIIKRFQNGVEIAQGRGSFDNYCVYIINGNEIIAPKDKDIFAFLAKEGEVYGVEKIYFDFVKIYNFTNKEIENNRLFDISKISKTYTLSNFIDVDCYFTVLYLAMIAENNKKNTKLGKKIKRLGVYQTLMLKYSPCDAAKFSYGRNWKSLNELCEKYGF